MNIVYERCAGLDVHKRSVTACAITPDERGQRHKEREGFSTMTPDVLRLRQWLTARGVTHVAIESTSVFWQPIYYQLEGHFELLLVNAQHIKAVPGRKTDTKDAEWLADLLQHGLLRPSFVPPAAQRQLRELTRSRTSLIQERSRAVNRLQKILEGANIKLASVASDLMGASARSMLEALLQGEADPTPWHNWLAGVCVRNVICLHRPCRALSPLTTASSSRSNSPISTVSRKPLRS